MTKDAERVGVILAGAGNGRRMGGVSKAFLPVLGRPLLAYSAEVFEGCEAIDAVCLVVAAGTESRAWGLVRAAGWRKVQAVSAGGPERQDSVRAGLEALDGVEWVVVHDVARPLIAEETIRHGLEAARVYGAAAAATRLRDTIKAAGRAYGNHMLVRATLNRRTLWAAQTPQVFRASLLREAHAAATESTATDDAVLVEALGRPVLLFEGHPHNLKLTVPSDVPLVECMLQRRQRDTECHVVGSEFRPAQSSRERATIQELGARRRWG